MDYSSNSTAAVFAVGSTNTTINIPVIEDNILEPPEMFSLNFSIPSSLRNRVHTGSTNTASGSIKDSTGKTILYVFANSL